MPARGADVVLEHLPRAVGVAHEVAARHVAVDAAGRPDPVRGAGELRPRDHERPRHDAVVDDLAPVVDVVDEAVERPDPLRQPALDRAPLVDRQDPRHEVERERAVDRAVAVGAADLERDPLAHEDRVAAAPRLDQAVVAERLERGRQRGSVSARRAAAFEHLVVVGAVPGHGRDPRSSAAHDEAARHRLLAQLLRSRSGGRTRARRRAPSSRPGAAAGAAPRTAACGPRAAARCGRRTRPWRTRGRLWPLRLWILRLTCRRPPGGTQWSPALRRTRPLGSGAAGGGAGGGGAGRGWPISVREVSDCQPAPTCG